MNAPARPLVGAPTPAPALPEAHAAARAARGIEWRWGAGAALIAVATAAIPLLTNPGFYFTDDYQTYFLPGFLEVARLIKAGEWPFLTPRLFQGGALLAEYQYALFNPVCVLLYLVLDAFDRLDRAAAFYALVHVGLLAGGTHGLARVVGASRPASLLAGLSAATSGWIVYWGAITWIPGLVAAAWLAWASAGLVLAYRAPHFVPAAAGLVFLTLASGWPFADAALLAGLAAGLGLAFWHGRDPRACGRVVLAVALGGALAAPAWMPLAALIGESSRQPHGLLQPGLQATPAALLGIGVPLWPQAWFGFNGSTVHPGPPTQYVSWWVPVAFLHAAWGRVRAPGGRATAVLLAVAAALALLAIAPGTAQLRWPFRYLPFAQIPLAVAAAWFMSRASRPWMPGPTLALIVGTGVLAFAPETEVALPQAGFTALLVLAARLALRVEGTARVAVLAGSHVVVFAALTFVLPCNGQVGAWPAPPERAAYRAPPLREGDAAIVLHGNGPYTETMSEAVRGAAFTELPHGNTALLTGARAISGYSPMPARGFASLCLGQVGASCEGAPERLVRVDPASGGSTLDRARVVRVMAEHGPRADAFAALAGPGWTRRPGVTADLFERDSPAPDLPGTLSRVPAGAHLADAAEGADAARVAMASAAGGRVVWARAWYPGYRATWNGAPLAVDVVNGFLVSAVVPAGEGVLALRYVPAGLVPGLALALAALLALAGLVAAGRRAALRAAP